ncbi:hypothetical protein OH76DRAFT_1454734 [Lentinus brumalis]|uniref:SAP domain-containing protein n=1 Tax=Lentinus brumalis TaxID=2498619 RepID=A0A371DH32_9APHY|nr:hypothetical protein OH76DRAFT_1454734 [Polyporus brumalis]
MYDLLEFWDPGVHYNQTALCPSGRLSRAALVPLVADIQAVRQLIGYGPPTHNHALCHVCSLPQHDIEEIDFSLFTPRDEQAHRDIAMVYRNAESTAERENIAKRTGIRWSELLRLEYWNPCAYVVVDTMHNLYLGLLQRHVRVYWGVNEDAEDGDASELDASAPPERPDEESMAKGVDLLLYGSNSDLLHAGRPVLYHLCVDRGLRRAGYNRQLVENLDKWVDFPVPEYGDYMTPEIWEAEKSLGKGNKDTTIAQYHKKTLVAMCAVRDLNSGGTKKELAARLTTYASSGNAELATVKITSTLCAEEDDEDDEDDEEPRRHGKEAVGHDTLTAYMEDHSRMELPSWVNAPPVGFGTKKHGKLSADQWRTLCSINFPVSLIRTWGFQEERRVAMLRNFIDLVEAVELVGLLETDEERIARAEVLLERYLIIAKELYKGHKIQPNHHLAMHLGFFLRLFGPVHSWRAFVFERFNYFLQSLDTNMKLGEIELTFMMRSCREANFRHLLRSPVVRRHMKPFSEALRALDKEDRRGMRLDAILRSADADSSTEEVARKVSRTILLDPAVYSALLHRINTEETVSPRNPAPSRTATPCSSASISGVFYKPRTRSTGDSNIMFRHPSLQGPSAGRIEKMFMHAGKSSGGQDPRDELYLVVKRLEELDEEDAAYDPYPQYGIVGGRLCYDNYSKEIFVLQPKDVLCHFAKTTMDHLVLWRSNAEGLKEEVRLKKPCVHVRPLDRVSTQASAMAGC